MSFINYSSREIYCKIVYYGPGLCGKTTNLQYIYNKTNPETKGKLSLRASITGEIVLDEVRVPVANLLPGVSGLKGPLSCLTQARYGIGWGALGAAMSVYERARSYTLDRVQFGKPLAGFQLTQQKLVEIHNEIGKGLLLAAELVGGEAPAAYRALLDLGLVTNAVTPTALRFAPPLTVTDEEIDEAVEMVGKVLAS